MEEIVGMAFGSVEAEWLVDLGRAAGFVPYAPLTGQEVAVPVVKGEVVLDPLLPRLAVVRRLVQKEGFSRSTRLGARV
eukprot:1851956-Lingulodinium_polyedra.AAC.1